ncbi:MAG: YncE family protein, partial [Thiohalorhabdaceae bacterium]
MPNKRTWIVRTGLALALLAATGLAPVWAGSGLMPKGGYATLQGDNAVADLASGDTWPAGKAMTYVTVSPDGKRVMATSSGEDRIYAYDATSGKRLATIPVGDTPKGIKIGRDGRYAIAVNEGGGTVSVIDVAELEVIKTIPVGDTPHNSVFSPDNRRVYVTLQGEHNVAVIDLKQMA